MKHARFLLIAVIVAALVAVALVPQITRGQTPSLAQIRRAADQHYAEKSYALALGEYGKVLKSLPANAPSRAELEYRVAVSLGKAQKWDAAFTAWDAFLATHAKDALWTARGQYQRGLLFNEAPHQGYKVGARIYRGEDYPHTKDAEKPEQVALWQEDTQATLKAFEAAVKAYDEAGKGSLVTVTSSDGHGEVVSTRKFYLQIKEPGGGYQNPDALAAEKTDLYFDLAKFLPRAQGWGSLADWKVAKTVDWAVHPHQAYNTKWPVPKKVLTLLARIPRLNPANTHNRLLAELARGLYVAQARNGWVRQEYVNPPGQWKIVQTIPYSKLNPFQILTQAANAAPNDPQAAQVRLIIAQWMSQKGDFVTALKLYRALVSRYPGSKWAEDAREAAQEIQREAVSLSASGVQPVGKKPSLTISSRNLKTLTLRAYKIDLARVLTDPNKISNPDNRFTRFDLNFGDLETARKLGDKVAEWTYDTKDRGAHQPQSETISAPLSETGAYLVEATGDDGRVRGGTIVLLSDLAIVKKTDKDNALCFVADARTGRPIPGAKVVVRETYYEGNKNHVEVSRGQADADGIFVAPRLRRPNLYSANVEALAYAPGDRYAITNPNGWYWNDEESGNRDEIKVYAYTDRPVYRPKQTVYFRDLLAKRVGGSDFAPLKGVPVTVIVSGPKGQVYTTTATSSQFGSVNGSFPLPDGAPLGEYSVSILLPNNREVSNYGGNRFRVEEYKKPEYEVKVSPSATQARFGDKVTATVNATYYYGAPVASAKVSYKVFRNPYYANYRFPQPYDWYYHYDDNGDYQNENADRGELVTQGEGTTDAKGNLSVTFAAAKGTRGYDGDYAYTVKADVVDASRRQISGEGILHVTNQAFYAYLNLQRGFYHAGDKVQIELRTQDADQQPVKTEGTLTVSRLTYEGPKEIATVIHTETLATDAQGKAFTTWASDQSGQFRIDWKARDKFEKPVVAQAPVWIEGDDLRDRQFRVGGITLLTDKTTYEEGETAHLLIVADRPDDWVLLTQETGNQILTRSLLHVPGRSRTVDVPIVRAHVPNFALAAVAVRDYQFYSWQQELFVPPSRQFLHMAVSGDKAEYRPGDTGIFHVKTTNAAGLPVASEVSLAVIDSSVFYIQKDYAPDIRLFYYGDRRNLGVNADSSQNISLEGKSESDIAAQKFKPHGIILPEMGRLPGGYYSTYYSGDEFGVLSNGNVVAYGGRRGDFGMVVSQDAISNASGNAVYDSDGPSGAVRHRMTLAVAPMVARAGGVPMGMPVTFTVRLSDREAGIDQLQRPYAQARVRNFFPDTAFWTPAVVTDKSTGEATLSVKFPDTLTTWKASARGLTPGVQVGSGDTQIITNKKLLVRLESPRFFVERDKVTLSAIVRNDLATDKQVRVSLATSGPLAAEGPLAPSSGGTAENPLTPDNGGTGVLTPPELGAGGTSSQTVTVPAHSEKRVDWTESVVGDGQAKVKMVAETDEESDAVEQSFPALTYGVQKFVTGSGVLQANQSSARLTVAIPAAHKPGSAALLVQVNPSLAATTLDALPYLADYPYGCVEQTMSRFLPSVLVAKTLREAGVNLDTLHKRALVMQERAQAPVPFGAGGASSDGGTSAYTYPTGMPGVMKTVELAESLPHGDRWGNPVFDPVRLKSMTDEGLSKLVSMQRSDGGWGWWPDSSESDSYMSAYVVYGLATARAAGVDVPSDTLSRGYMYLAKDLKDRDDQRDLAVWEAFALSHSAGGFPASGRHVVSVVYAKRDKLSAYGQALLALTLHNLGENDKAQVVCRNLQNTATIDAENGTASWRNNYGYWWDWYNNDTETTAWVLKAYLAILPKSDLSPLLVKWLVNNKHGSAWHSTKETAMAVYALTDYIRANNELAPDYTVTVALGDKVSRTFKINRDNALLFDNQFLVPDALLTSGTQTVSVTKQGAGRLYYSTALQYFTTEEQIKGVGTELKVQRRYFRLTPKTKQVADWEGGTFNELDYNRQELADGANLKSGDLLEVELVLDSKNNYDYCCFEDMKPAGCEPLQLRSGHQYGDGLCSNMELRDTKTAFFVDHLPQGTRVLRYRLRAEVPGAFHALPTNGYAMYAPDVRALSDGWHVTVGDDAPQTAHL